MAYKNKVFRPKAFNTPMMLLIPTYSVEKGKTIKTYGEGVPIHTSFVTFGGTEQVVDGVYSIIDTATVETWYRTDLKADCRVKYTNGATYEIISEPENVEMRNCWLIFKVRRVSGGA